MSCLLRAADLTMWTPPAFLGPPMKVCLTFGFLGMLRQSNLASRDPSTTQLDITRHTCRGFILIAPPGVLLIDRWTITLQVVCTGYNHVLSIPQIHHHPADLVAAYRQLLTASPTTHPNQPFLTFNTRTGITIVTVKMLTQELSIMLHALRMDSTYPVFPP